MNRAYALLCLIVTYVLFAILLNSVGTVILQVITDYGVSKTQASVLEGFKDLPIAIVSFLVAAYLPRLGYVRAMQLGVAIVTVAAICMPLFPAFLTTKLLFLAVGASFALVKVSVYTLVGVITDDSKGHASVMNTIEGCFMVGVLAGYWLFGAFIGDDVATGSWLQVYWLLAGLGVVNILLLSRLRIDMPADAKAAAEQGSFAQMIKLALLPLVLSFVLAVFLYVLIEQGIGTWLPTFNKEVLALPSNISVQITSIFAAALAIGRLSAGAVMRYVGWYPVLNVCLVAMAVLVVLTLPLTRVASDAPITGWSNVPLAAYLLPMIGLFMAPIYPAINSVVLSALPKKDHAAMTGLIVVFSALGGTTGSIITGWTFANFDGQTAFYLSLVPMALMAGLMFWFYRLISRQAEQAAPQPA